MVAIIGVLATIVLSSLSEARARARDSKRLADIGTIRTALEIYNIDNGLYPMFVGGWASSGGTPGAAGWEALKNLLGMTLPVDPINTTTYGYPSSAADGRSYVYSYFAAGNTNYRQGRAYMLVVNLESKADLSQGVDLCGPVYGYNDAIVVGTDLNGDFVPIGPLTAK